MKLTVFDIWFQEKSDKKRKKLDCWRIKKIPSWKINNQCVPRAVTASILFPPEMRSPPLVFVVEKDNKKKIGLYYTRFQVVLIRMLSTLYFLPLAKSKDKIGKRIASLTGKFSRLRREDGAGNAIMNWHGRGLQPHRQISTAVRSSSSDFIKSRKSSSVNGRMMIERRYHKNTMMFSKRFESSTAKESEKNKGIVEMGRELSRWLSAFVL